MTNEEKINLIGQKIFILSNNLDKYQAELNHLKQQLELLQKGQTNATQASPAVAPVAPKVTPLIETKIDAPIAEKTTAVKEQEYIKPIQQEQFVPLIQKDKTSKFNFEEFIGGKLITIIGIVILVIGIGIGVKYAIDKDMLGPLGRIVLAYLAGGILLTLALILKAKYKSFSAVLLSGGMASLYFTTYAAYSMYNLFPQLIAFIIMVIFTAFTVFAATVYALEIIGIIGLVGAYAVPMLLSDGSGKIEIMFSYMLIINIGILILSFKKYWQLLNHVAFGLTWLIVGTWYVVKFDWMIHSWLMLGFSSAFFMIFYISNMSYKILKQEKFGVLDVIRIVMNSFIFFGLGYATLNHGTHTDYLGAFAVLNALVHLVFSFIVFKNKLLDRKLFYLLIAMVLSFITIAAPIQFEGNWVTLFWAAEAALLFTVGRFKKVRFYEWLGYIMILFATISLWHDWTNTYFNGFIRIFSDYEYFKNWTPVINIYLFTSVFVIISMATMIFVHHKKELTEEEYKKHNIYRVLEYMLGILLIITIYCTFSNEISAYYKMQYHLSQITIPAEQESWIDSGNRYNGNILDMEGVVMMIYNLLFFAIISILGIFKFKRASIRWGTFGVSILLSLLFITAGLSQINELTHVYLTNENGEYYIIPSHYIYIRYVSITLFAILLFLTIKVLKTKTFEKYSILQIYTGSIIHLLILVVLSNELVHFYTLKNYDADFLFGHSLKPAYKLGFTALWGIYSFLLIALGIFRKNRIMRISAISLFGITLLKLVTYDTWDLSTGYKVIAYILLGAILLTVAFLYQKFKTLIFGDDENSKDVK